MAKLTFKENLNESLQCELHQRHLDLKSCFYPSFFLAVRTVKKKEGRSITYSMLASLNSQNEDRISFLSCSLIVCYKKQQSVPMPLRNAFIFLCPVHD